MARQGLEVGAVLRVVIGRCEKRAAGQLFRCCDSQQLGQRRQQVDQTRWVVLDPWLDAGTPKDQRHSQRRLVGKESVGLLAMRPESLAVIGGQQNQCGLLFTRQKAAQNGCQLAIDAGNFGEVGATCELARAYGSGGSWGT